MDINDIYQSETLKASDLKGQAHVVVIASVTKKEFDNGDKLVLTFQHRKKAFVVNKTNANRIAFAHGNDTDNWIGREIELYPDLVDFQGKTVEAIRVRPVARAAPARQAEIAPQQHSQQAVQKRDGYELSTGTPQQERHPNAPGNDGGGFHSDDIPF